MQQQWSGNVEHNKHILANKLTAFEKVSIFLTVIIVTVRFSKN